MLDSESRLAVLMMLSPCLMLLVVSLVSRSLARGASPGTRLFRWSLACAVLIGVLGGVGGVHVGLLLYCVWWYPGSNLCGLPALLSIGPLAASLSMAAYLGVWWWARRVWARRGTSS
jgi:hypothetical protein